MKIDDQSFSHATAHLRYTFGGEIETTTSIKVAMAHVCSGSAKIEHPKTECCGSLYTQRLSDSFGASVPFVSSLNSPSSRWFTAS